MTTVITGGTLVTAAETYQADLLVDGEQIIRIGRDLAADADSVIDATGKLVMPGGIDVHTHLSMPFGGTVSCDDYTTGQVAALWGGTTMHIDFATQPKGGSLQDGLDAWAGRANGAAVSDYGFHMIITDPTDAVLDEIPSMVEQGVTSFKLFLAYPNVLMVDDDTLFRVFQRTAAVGALGMIHAENGPVIDGLVQQALAKGETDPKYHAATRPAELEAEATARAITIANLTGTDLYVVHVTCESAARAIKTAREAGHANIMGETCTQYLYLTADDLARPGFEGAKYVCSPPLRTEADQEYLWGAIARGELQAVSTDHCPFNYEDQKSLGKGDFSKIPNGMPGIEERLALLSEGVHNGRINWNRFVELTATNPAKIFGAYPRKGTLAVGADADVVVWDPEALQTLTASDQHSAIDYNCYEGMQVHGRAEVVMSRGEVVLQGGEFTGEPGRGKFIKRTTSGRTLDARTPANA